MPRPSAPAPSDQRAAHRFDARLPLRIQGCTGVTLDVSNHGVYFLAARPPRVGSLVEFTLEYTLYGRKQRLQCEAKVLRVQPRGPRFGVAARLLAPLFAPEEGASAG